MKRGRKRFRKLHFVEGRGLYIVQHLPHCLTDADDGQNVPVCRKELGFEFLRIHGQLLQEHVMQVSNVSINRGFVRIDQRERQ